MKDFKFNGTTFSYANFVKFDITKFSKHVHSDFEFLLFLSGDASYVVEHKKFALIPDVLVLSKPMQYHFIEINSADIPYERYYVQFDLTKFPESIRDKINGFPETLRLDKNSRVFKIMKSMRDYSDIFPPKAYPELYDSLLCELVFAASLEGSGGNVNFIEADDVTIKALEYINAHIFEPITIKAIADGVYTSPSSLCHRFKKSMQIGVYEYVTKKKMTLADGLLRRGESPLSVAAKLGYQDYSTFYRSYKAAFSRPPKAAKN